MCMRVGGVRRAGGGRHRGSKGRKTVCVCGWVPCVSSAKGYQNTREVIRGKCRLSDKSIGRVTSMIGKRSAPARARPRVTVWHVLTWSFVASKHTLAHHRIPPLHYHCTRLHCCDVAAGHGEQRAGDRVRSFPQAHTHTHTNARRRHNASTYPPTHTHTNTDCVQTSLLRCRGSPWRTTCRRPIPCRTRSRSFPQAHTHTQTHTHRHNASTNPPTHTHTDTHCVQTSLLRCRGLPWRTTCRRPSPCRTRSRSSSRSSLPQRLQTNSRCVSGLYIRDNVSCLVVLERPGLGSGFGGTFGCVKRFGKGVDCMGPNKQTHAAVLVNAHTGTPCNHPPSN